MSGEEDGPSAGLGGARRPVRMDGGTALLDRILDPDQLYRAWEDVRANRGAAGGDEVSLARYQRRLELNLLHLAASVRDGSYRPGRVRHVVVQTGDKTRRITILSVADRVLQRATLNLLAPRFERTFLNRSYGYRSGRSLTGAVHHIVRLRNAGYRYVVDADIRDCFPSIDHQILLSFLDHRLPDPRVLALFRQWVVIGATKRAERRRGLCLGAVVSPLLCNVYLHPLDRALAKRHVQSVRYADDFVVLCESEAERAFALDLVAKHLTALRLQLHREKTRLTDFDEGFTFLGVTFQGRELSFDAAGRHVVVDDLSGDWAVPVPDGYD